MSTSLPFRELLIWRMCSDPWPAQDVDMNAIDDWLNSVAQEKGYADWIDAYHKI